MATVSDHLPLLVTVSEQQQHNRRCARQFRFENMWLEDDGCRRVVEECWSKRIIQSPLDFAKAIEICGMSLIKWNNQVYGNLQRKIREKEQEIEHRQSMLQNLSDNIEIDICKA